MKRIFIIGPVRAASARLRGEMEDYYQRLRAEHAVYLPSIHTPQNLTGLEICRRNLAAIEQADEVHLFYRNGSQGTHFDMGMSFALGKTMVVVSNTRYGPGKSFARMADEWDGRGVSHE